MHPTISAHSMSRRSLLAGGALAATSVLLAGTPATAASQPIPREFVLWGSSSANSGLAEQYPDGPRGDRPVIRIENVLSPLLGAAGHVPAVGGDRSHQTLSMRSAAHPYKPNFGYNSGSGALPSRGQIIVNTHDGRVPNWRKTIPGTISGVPCSLRADRYRHRKLLISRTDVGEELHVGTGPGSCWHTGLEATHRGKVHLIWTGKNNIDDPAGVLADTRACFAVEPSTSVVMAHWHTYHDRAGTVGWDRVRTVNDAYRTEYGSRYHDVMADLTDPEMWNLDELTAYRIGTSPEDRAWLAMGLPPRSVVGSDLTHLNALGNTIIAHGLHRFLTGTTGLY